MMAVVKNLKPDTFFREAGALNYSILAAAATAILIGGGLYFYGSPERTEPVDKKINQPAPQEVRGVGIIDIEKIQAAHPDGETLAQLCATELRLRLELNEAMKVVELPKPAPPETDSEVFDEVAWQKNAQRVMSQLAELESRKKLAAEEYRKKTEPQYIAERDKINAEFLNENFNIQLKLKNSDHLHLSQEKVNELLERLEQVELERNRLQGELFDRWNAEVAKYAAESVAADEARLRAESDRLRAQVEAQARKKESDVTARNQKLMDDALREMESRQIRRRELLAELQEVGKERAQLEQRILESIADKATMLAAVNRLEMVFVKREPAPEEKFSLRREVWRFELKPPERVGAVLFPGKAAHDLTDELIKEINRL